MIGSNGRCGATLAWRDTPTEGPQNGCGVLRWADGALLASSRFVASDLWA